MYEAGFCGFWIHERLTALGIDNIMINPTDVPTKSSEKLRKTDAVDSGKLTRSLRANKLKGITRRTAYRWRFQEPLRLIMSVPGFGQATRMAFLSEICDITRFRNAEQLATYRDDSDRMTLLILFLPITKFFPLFLAPKLKMLNLCSNDRFQNVLNP